jgi:hypothetical protein
MTIKDFQQQLLTADLDITDLYSEDLPSEVIIFDDMIAEE